MSVKQKLEDALAARAGLSHDLDARLRANIETLPPWQWRADDVFVHFNEDGQNPPLFWCFNSWVEAIALARVLGADQPVVAMHSLEKVIDAFEGKETYFHSIIDIYRDGILERIGDKGFVLGGNCQGAGVMEIVAQDIMVRTLSAQPLVVLEYTPRFAFPGHIDIVFGAQSELYNPFLQGKDPLPIWNLQFASHAHHEIPGAHGQFFRAPGIDSLAKVIIGAIGKVGQGGGQ